MEAAKFLARRSVITESGYGLEPKIPAMTLGLKFQVTAASCPKRFTINLERTMKNVLSFDVDNASALSDALNNGLQAYATDCPRSGLPTTLWLQLCNGRTLRIRPEMHDLSGWNEIGTLTFEEVGLADAPEMTRLPVSWADVQSVQKLIYKSNECEAECGLAVNTTSGDTLIVVTGADVYTLAIEAPFHHQVFTPENDLITYFREEF
ncbi:hypothetical protein [Herbaspirillum sp. YR522]|uniref:hypothetical protein n=1 Tax=Herbaspirillum sp. YR522 TaxID=1144342 RepID=UPI00026F8861|nr:hypothetical protein [Herbaspirillum sp. YR522]EJN03274.1 hypothetical protein PMI40_02823 [Herbaspirillum sp. YR522]